MYPGQHPPGFPRNESKRRAGIWLLTILALFLLHLPSATATARDRDTAEIKAEAIPCFVYHRFGDSRYPSTNIPLDKFKAHLAYLREKEYTVLTLGQAMSCLRSEKDVPDRAVVLTVDDGYATFLSEAMPLLREYGFQATLFVQTQNVGDSGYLGWDELRRLQAEGIEIGNHSASHAHFLNMKEERRLKRFRNDVQKAQGKFAFKLEEAPDLFSYPFGEYTPGMQEVIRDMGFTAATAQKSGVMHVEGDRYALPRFPMGGPYATLEGFISKANMRPLRVRQEQPKSPVVENNPPTLTLDLEAEAVDLSGLQCFVGGGRDCNLKRDKKDPSRITVTATKKLTQRRTLYTITAPSNNGPRWHWFSHLWVRPKIAE
ncbi:MAG: polysaccharide deacetylase family protein [Desulfohalobiaceae bacterium]|nr:polysaccharide deacetylase family protein [Desulfohalobiaceae bacterium]